jgi:hypothetical protein
LRKIFPASNEASSVNVLCLSSGPRTALQHASSDGKKDRTSANAADERSSNAASDADCRHSSQHSPFGSPLKIASKTDVSTATALIRVSICDAGTAGPLVRAIHPAIPPRCVRRVAFSGRQIPRVAWTDPQPCAVKCRRSRRRNHLCPRPDAKFGGDKRFHTSSVRIPSRKLKSYFDPRFTSRAFSRIPRRRGRLWFPRPAFGDSQLVPAVRQTWTLPAGIISRRFRLPLAHS